ncbi:hypothetical protein [Actinoallomurus bryophytorum]|uniref:MmyB family transcriptional regulator n=1 Tax=Actinoallomurus bryophytorum TaxID=1490222 RepID=UPI003CCC4F56
MVGPDVDDPRLTELVGELSARSEDFRRLWSRHDVRPQIGGGVHKMRHPQVGEHSWSSPELQRRSTRCRKSPLGRSAGSTTR